MATVDLVMPKMGESIAEATILKWHKKPGDVVKTDETVLEIATDKVDSEVPSTENGIIEEILFHENDVVPVGAVIARIKTGTSANIPATETASPDQGSAQKEQDTGYGEEEPSDNDSHTAGAGAHRFYSPLVLNIAAREGISMFELENIPGTGNEGRVSKRDILQYVNYKKTAKGEGREQQARGMKYEVRSTREEGTKEQEEGAGDEEWGTKEKETKEKGAEAKEQTVQRNMVSAKEEAAAPAPPPPGTYGGNVEIVEMDRMRKLISAHMIRSKEVSAHVSSFSEADVTNLVLWRDKMKKEFEKREGTKITFTPLFIEAIVKCIKRYPLINSSVDGDRIIIKKDINIGMATALSNGNLIVPVIKNAGQLNLVGLAKQVNTLADNARNNRLQADDTQNGTFTFTNVGTFGSLMGTPIINQPQVAILAAGIIKKRPVVLETPHGDSIAIRHMMYLSMSYDHRIVDGSLGATFLTAVANELENFNINREI